MNEPEMTDEAAAPCCTAETVCSWHQSQEGKCEDCGKVRDRVIVRLGLKLKLCDDCNQQRSAKK